MSSSTRLNTSCSLSRSVYVSRLRRAFLLQAHPDRFRTHPATIQRKQAELIQAISERMGAPDFLQYYQNRKESDNEWRNSSRIQGKKYEFVLQQKGGGNLVKNNVDLNDSVGGILYNLRNALHKTGHSFPPPPKDFFVNYSQKPKSPEDPNKVFKINNNISWISPNKKDHQKTKIDHQFDINSNIGRDLRHFLDVLDPIEVEQRQCNRMEVTAAAYMVREAYSFASVDGTGLGWSSNTLAVLLRTLISLYHDHSSKFKVKSFYPLKLVWSSADHHYYDKLNSIPLSSSLDLYGGILYLNPASTPIQWLDHHFLQVTPKMLDQHSQYQEQLQHNSRIVNEALGVKFLKGHTCSSHEYHDVIQRLANKCSQNKEESCNSDSSLLATKTAKPGVLAHERVFCRVESFSPQIKCGNFRSTQRRKNRRGKITKEGQIQIHTEMEIDEIISCLSQLAAPARQRLAETQKLQKAAKETIRQLQHEFGILKIQRRNRVSLDSFVESLVRLLLLLRQNDAESIYEGKQVLAGKELTIVGKGQFCHLGDDGALQIPWDWK